MINHKHLTELGFSHKEAIVYLSLLELGPSSATEIARKAKINRTTSYDILESLSSDRLVRLTGKAKVKKYAAENPSKVISFLEGRLEQARENLSAANALLPQLLSIYNTKEKPRVKFYEGIDALKEAFEDTLTAKGEIVAYAAGGDMFNAVSEKYFRDYFKKRAAKNIHIRVIVPADEEVRSIIVNNKEELRTSILVPKSMFDFSIETNIYDNKVMIASWREKFAVIIESADIANAQRNIFELSWEGAKKFKVD